jgi:O-antigen/teichoic acid export membrane protein
MNNFRPLFSKKFSSDACWSLSGNLVSVFAGLLAVKIITSFVKTDEYGQASLALGLVALLSSLFVLSLTTTQNRLYFDYLERGMGLWFARVFNLVLGAAGLISLFFYLVVAMIYKLQGKAVYLELLLPIALFLIARPYMSSLLLYLEAHRKQALVAVLTILQKMLYPIILWLFLVSAFSQAKAIIVSQVLVVLVLLAIFRVPKEQKESCKYPVNRREELSNLKNSILSFGWALPLGNFAMWIQTTSDRYLLEYFLTFDAVGVYVINYGFWSIPYTMLNGWLEILTRPILYNKAAKNEWGGVRQVIAMRTLFGLGVSIIGTILIYFVGESIASVMLGTHYWKGRNLMMCIAVAHCFYVVGYSVLPAFLAGKRPKIILLATSVAALINIVVNLFTIPAYGMLGAAMSTLIAYFVWALILVVLAHFFLQGHTSQGMLAGGKVAT